MAAQWGDASIGLCGIEMQPADTGEPGAAGPQSDCVELKSSIFSAFLICSRASIGLCGIEIYAPRRLHASLMPPQSDCVELKLVSVVAHTAVHHRLNRTVWN